MSLRLSSLHDAKSQHCRSISESSRLCQAGSEYSDNTSEVESQHSPSAGDAETECSHSISEASESHVRRHLPRPLRSLLAKMIPCLPCLWADFHDDDDVASISASDPIWSHPIFPARPLQILRLSLLNDLDSTKAEQMNDPWHFFREIDALKRESKMFSTSE
ncbi:hypothetical protein EV421DRAFT_1426608 [Armillaria borealis]|uniref:Uncharacterized protein n=1 Tax=Armillaria borealis TaxID=47425 RepID=A0AA39MH03_9AGAR|nr:hypothetical protein EV421DRAFT_1426608 [Armillaria borealis]